MTKQPDILFIVLDTQRADRLGCYGYGKNLTPHLDRFANEGVLFDQAISPAQWTLPSHASLFSGLYPTQHQVTQSVHSLGIERPHMAELLSGAGYETVGFCNNPLVGILNNGLKRGFQSFYNYGGAVPSLPHQSTHLPFPLDHVVEKYTQFLRRISYPIQNYFGRSDLAFRLSLNSLTTPLWSRLANFKGQNERSVGDVVRYLGDREERQEDRPLFLFLNLMETHLPFWPPGRFVDQVAPYFRDSKEARKIIQTWNREAYRWAAPLAEPFDELEGRVLSDLYDAEVAYQDYYLGALFDLLRSRGKRDNTLTVVVSDHGDGLGEHGYMGHAFVAYQELVHVPLIVHWPASWSRGSRVATPVSTRRVFHTIMEAASPQAAAAGVDKLSLRKTVVGEDPENGTAYSEVYPPLNFVRAVEQRQPHLIEAFGCLSNRRAIVRSVEGHDHKLIQVDDKPLELYDLQADPLEHVNRRSLNEDLLLHLDSDLRQAATSWQSERNQPVERSALKAEDEAQLKRRLRGLGYVD